jgi:hypothetical protein
MVIIICNKLIKKRMQSRGMERKGQDQTKSREIVFRLRPRR